MIKKIMMFVMLSCSICCFARNKPSNEMMKMFEKVPFFEFKRHYIDNITISYVMIEGHIYVFIRDQSRETGGLVHSIRCPLCLKNANN